MADYVIGDIQGCYEPFMRLLEKICFDPAHDKLWLVGDLVNRGPESLAVLRFVYQHRNAMVMTLGNHDFYLLIRLFVNNIHIGKDETIQDILEAPDAWALGHWLRQQPLLYRDAALKMTMCHAGIAPMWTVEAACGYAQEVEAALRGDQFLDFLNQIYGDQPTLWSDALTGIDRLRCITNYFTRMRFCDERGAICLDYKGTREQAPAGLIPWFLHPKRVRTDETLLVGHWSALGEVHPVADVYNLDTGCVWGQMLTAMRLQDKVFFTEKG